ncbi:MAG: class I SAM-dependent methyltransferase [Desulfurococcales archaeon]|jgi:ubiquinone/menaquinone biosynthesis C-methylase UbiE|nr:class I SAM-dependent methyltransferase [Desulfurococcales archaeon]
MEIINILRCPVCRSDLERQDKILQCNGCGNKYGIIDNRIVDLIVDQREWVKIFEMFPRIYDPWSQIGWRLTGRGSLEGFYSDLIKDLGEGVLIDVGCGTGTMISMLEKRGFRGTLIGIDISKSMLKVAVKKTRKAVFIRASMDNIPLKDATVDHYISSLTIHIAEDKRKVFEEMKRVLKDMGTFRIAVAATNSFRGKLFSLLLGVRSVDENAYIVLLRSLGLNAHKIARYGIFISIYGTKQSNK